MRVAIFGGSFNPPHVAHQLVALYLLETRPIAELWMIPCFRHPFEKTLAPFQDRLEMCERLAAPLAPRIKVSDVEGRLGGESRTLLTVRALQAQHPENEFLVVIGQDLEQESHRWFGAAELRERTPFIVVGRTGFARSGSDQQIDMPAVSSSEIRQRLQNRQPVEHLVPRRVLDYIRQRGLYGGHLSHEP
jgi:nicotinate-nucleotide adenylyltransferase